MSFYRGKTVLVAGGTGTIGIPTVRLLAEAGARVSVVSLDDERRARSVLPEGVAFARQDLTLLSNCLAATDGQEIVFNLVGVKGSVGIGQKKVASYLVPMLGFQTNLMEAAFRNRVQRFLFVGSICSYPQSDQPKLEDTMWDGMPKQNDRIPGLAKRIGEIQGEAYLLEHGWDAVRTVRPANVFGPHDDFNPQTAQVIPALISRVCGGENPLEIWGDGTAVRDFIFSEDLAYWLLVTLEQAPPLSVVNLGSGQGTTIRQTAETIAGCLRRPPALAWNPAQPVGDPVRLLSVARAQALLGYHPLTPFPDAIARTMRWYCEQAGLNPQEFLNS
jgi:GDP-L-fucose synthase